MKSRFLILLAAVIPCCAPLPCPAAPLTPAQAAMVRDIQAKAAQAIAQDDSEKAEELTEHQAHLTAESAAVDANQKAADLGDKLAALQVKYDAAVETIWWYRLRFWGPLTMAVAAVAIYLLTRFTSWGARTFGPYILGAETVAAKAAALA